MLVRSRSLPHRACARAAALSSMLALGCNRPAETPPPEAPSAEAELALESEPETAETAEPDPLADLGSDGASEPSKRPDPIEVVVEAVMAKEAQEQEEGAKVIEVGADARFAVHMEIESVDPPTPLLPPGRYTVLLHSPSKTFRGPVPKPGKRVRFRLSIFPEDPADPHDEVFFATMWLD